MQTQHEWESVVVRDVVLKTATWNPAKEHRDMIRYVDVSAVSRERSAIEEATNYPADQAPGRARKIIHTNDTIFATIRPSLRRIAQVPEQFDNELASTAFCVLRPNPKKINPDFLFHAVSSEPFVEAVVNLETGASYPAVRDRDILDQSIPLPPIAEQKDIGSSLNLVRTALLHQSNSLTVAQELKRAAMRELFTKGLRGEPQKQTDIGLVPESWDVSSIGQHFQVASGGTPSRNVPEYWSGGTIPWVKTTEVSYCSINSTEEHITQSALANSAAKMFPVGTILMAMYGQGVTRGKVAVLGIEAACNQACAAIFQSDKKVDDRYLFQFLTSRYEDIRRLAHGGQQQNLNLEIVRDLALAFPSLEEQCEIASILDAIDRKIDLHKRKKAVLEELFKSLLHKLMTGEIRVSELDLTAIQAGGH